MLKLPFPNSLNLAWKMLKGNVIRLQPWFKIRRVSWLYSVAYIKACHKDHKGDWPHRGILHSFWRWEILVWNLVFIRLGGQFGRRYVIPMATRHIVQSSLKVRDAVSFFFKTESAQPIPFLPHEYFIISSEFLWQFSRYRRVFCFSLHSLVYNSLLWDLFLLVSMLHRGVIFCRHLFNN